MNTYQYNCALFVYSFWSVNIKSWIIALLHKLRSGHLTRYNLWGEILFLEYRLSRGWEAEIESNIDSIIVNVSFGGCKYK